MAKDIATGKAKGGLARADSLTPEQRKEIAQRAALARWEKDKIFAATHTGNFEKEFGLNIECYVLNDGAKTAVISQRGMGQAIGFSRRGSRFLIFVNSQTMDEFIGRDLRQKIENPFIFQLPGAAAGNPVT